MRFRIWTLLPLFVISLFVALGHFADRSKAQGTNHPPVANPDSVSVHGSQMTPASPNALSNDSDPDNDPLSVSPGAEVDMGSIGRGSVGPTGGISCTGGRDSGSIVIPYSITDGHGGGASSTVTCENHNSAPIAVTDFYVITGTSFSSRIGEGLRANDTDPDPGDTLCVSFVNTSPLPDNAGTFSISGDCTGGLTVSRNPSFSGEVTIQYRLGDQFLTPADGTVVLVMVPDDVANNIGRFCESPGQPVNPTNGNMWLEQVDYRLRGIGENIEITRFYNSTNQQTGILGLGWTTQYDESLVLYGDKLARVNMPDGKAAYFYRTNTTDNYANAFNDSRGQISSDGSGYTLTFLDGGTHRFSTTGKLQWQKDRNGNQTTLFYNTNGTIDHITDAFGRTLAFSYSTNQIQISDSLGTVATYVYFTGTSVLQSVTYQDLSQFNFQYDTTTAPGKTLLKEITDASAKVIESHTYS